MFKTVRGRHRKQHERAEWKLKNQKTKTRRNDETQNSDRYKITHTRMALPQFIP